jgi:ubiquinone/menaquinone biosynthesis C-methylase UbiE
MIIYDEIGRGYNATRHSDPYIADRLIHWLQPEKDGQYLEIGCGTGNYLSALSERGYRFSGVDPSEVMLEAARKAHPEYSFSLGSADHIPFPDHHFNGAIAVLTFQHWEKRLEGLRELRRVLKPGSRLVFFSYTPEQQKGYWLDHYFGGMIDRIMKGIPSLKEMEELLVNAGFEVPDTEKYFVRPDLLDHFLYSYKFDSQAYLDENIRNNTSAFRLFCPQDELDSGLERLRADIQSGKVNEVMSSYENDLGDYLFYCSRSL